MAVFGDLGSVNAKSLSYLQEETQQGKYDAFLHVGKFFFSGKVLCFKYMYCNVSQCRDYSTNKQGLPFLKK